VQQNWAGTYSYTGRIERPSTLEDAQQVVADAARLRPLGTRHSFNEIADGEVLLDLTGLSGEPVLDEAARTVTVPGGTRYARVATWLEERGWALHNMGSLPHISVAGAVSTGTHGSGTGNGSLSTAVRGLTFLAPDGSERRIAAGTQGFEGSVVALGALGPVTSVTLAVEPSFRVRQDVFTDLAWDAVLADLPGIMGAAYSVSLFTRWADDFSLWLKTRLPGGVFDATALGALPAEQASLAEGEDNTTPQGGVPGPWSERLPHFRIDSTPSNGDEIQTEYWVPLERATDAIRAVRELAPRLANALHISELRSVAADELWLSPGYRRTSLCVHFTWQNRPDAVGALIPEVEAALAPFDPRPHWGKVFRQPASYERAADFRALAAAVDPAGKFRNGFLERVGL
jgi:xylitol oxidase